MNMINFHSEIPAEKNLLDLITELKKRIEIVEDSIGEISNCIYTLQKQIEAVDSRIDIILGEKEKTDVRRTDGV